MNPNEPMQYPIPTGQPPVSLSKAPKKRDVLSLLSLIFGLISGGSAIFLGCFCFRGFTLTLYLGIAAIVLGVIALVRKTPWSTRAITGLITGGIGVVCALVLALVVLTILILSMANGVPTPSVSPAT